MAFLVRATFAAFLSVFVSFPSFAQEAPAPKWQVGTTCVYEENSIVYLGKQKGNRFRYQQAVTAVTPTTVTMIVGQSHSTRVVTTEGNLMSHGSTRFTPAFPTYQFPLFVGKSWAGSTQESNTKNSGTTNYAVTARVSAIETVTVGAGTFQAYRIDISSDYETFNSNGHGKNKALGTAWYSPQMNRMVKAEDIMYDWNGNLWTHEVHELQGCGSK